MRATTRYERSTAGPGPCQPETNEAVFFDGVGDSINVGSHAGTNFGTNQDFTWEMWLQTDANFPHQNGPVNLLVDKEPVPLGPYPYRLSIRNATNGLKGKVTFQRYDGTRNPTLDSVKTVDDSKPHHVVAVKRGTTMEVWIDGVLDSTTIDTTTASTTNRRALHLGGKSTHVDLEYKGLLDEIAVYNYALSKARIETHYKSGKCIATEPAPPLVSSLSPADGTAFVTTAPTLSATYYDPNSGDDGYVEFEVYKDGALVASNAAGAHMYVQPGQRSSWQIPAGILAGATTYTWRARSFDGVSYSDWTSSPASRAFTIGGASVNLRQWSTDSETGRVDYDFTATASGLNAGGDMAGPCAGIECSWRVEMRHTNGAVQKSLGTLATGTLASNTASLNKPLSGIYWGEVTEIKTVVEPFPCYGCSQARGRYDSSWVKVGDPYPAGDVTLAVNLWKRDLDTRVITYDLSVSAGGASQVRGPCEEKACQWRIEALHEEGTTSRLDSEQLPGGTWSFTKSRSGTTSGNITHLKATLDSMCGVNMEYWCWDPWETYRTQLVPVSDHVYKGQNLVAGATTLRPVLTRNPTFFCERFLLRAGTHHLRSTLSDQYIACEAAVVGAELATEYAIVQILESIFDAPGPAGSWISHPSSFHSPTQRFHPSTLIGKMRRGVCRTSQVECRIAR